ncbi:MAG: ferric reductase-like transmembrane domain-containing protein [Candidatus Moraniibacteriota bacterium]
METFLKTIDLLLVLSFRLHDGLSRFLMEYMGGIKRALLVIAHLTLFGLLFPEYRRSFGEQGLNLLFVILFLSPLSKIFRMRFLFLLMGFRRQLGILFAYLIIIHGVGFLIDPMWYALIIAPYLPGNIFGIESRILFGIVAFFLTLPLLLTSNEFSNRILGKNWKRLHRIVYVLFAFAVFHKMYEGGRTMRPIIDPSALLGALSLIGSYAFLKLLAWKNFFPPLRRAIELVSLRYRSYHQSTVKPVVFPPERPSKS